MVLTNTSIIEMNDKYVTFDFSSGTGGLDMAAGGMVAHGDSYFWDMCGTPQEAWNFSDGSRTGSAPLPPAHVKDADLYEDGFVDYKDLNVLANNWLAEANDASYFSNKWGR